MRLLYAFAAEHANITQDGKLNVLGILDRVYAYQFPATHRELFVINSLETDAVDDGSVQQLGVSIIDADGKSLAEAGGELHIHGPRQKVNQIHIFQDLLFETAGTYEIHIRINQAVVGTMALDVVQLEAPPLANPN